MNHLDKVYHVTMSVQQMAVLLCFNDRDSVKVLEIKEGTKLDQDVLTKILRSLIEAGLLKSAVKVLWQYK